MKASGIIAVILLCSVHAIAQDPVLFYAQRASPFIDPSRTGFSPEIMATFQSRQQWMRIPDPFRTDAYALTYGPGKQKQKGGRWGTGITVLTDRSGQPTLRTVQAKGVLARHLPLSENSALSFGFAVGLDQRNFDATQGQWASQYDGMAYDPSAATGESFGNLVNSRITSDVGLSYTLLEPGSRLQNDGFPRLVIGVAMTRAATVLIGGENAGFTEPQRRYTAHTSFTIPLDEDMVTRLYVEAVADRMGPLTTARLNVAIGKDAYRSVRMPETSRSIGYRAGLGYRYNEALFLHGMVQFQMLGVGLQYGWRLSAANALVQGKRSAEIMVEYRLRVGAR